MKRFLQKILTYFLVYLGIFGILLFSLGWYLEKDRIYSKKRLLFEKNKKEAVYIITGTSHTFWGMNPTLFPEKTINIAEKNKPIDIDLKILERSIGDFQHAKYVIIPIDYFTFYFDGHKDNGAAKLYHHWGLPYTDNSFLKKYHITTCGIDPEEIFLNKKAKDKWFGYEAQKNDYSKVSVAERNSNYQSRRDLWNKYFIDTSLAEGIYAKLEHTVALLQSRHIQPVLITMPLDPGFYNALDPALHKKNRELIGRLVQKTGAPYMDFQENMAFNDLSLFKNQDHLNDKGTTVLTNLCLAFIRSIPPVRE